MTRSVVGTQPAFPKSTNDPTPDIGPDNRVPRCPPIGANQLCRHADTPEINLKALFDIVFENRMRHQCHLDRYHELLDAWRREWPTQRVYERTCLFFSSQ